MLNTVQNQINWTGKQINFSGRKYSVTTYFHTNYFKIFHSILQNVLLNTGDSKINNLILNWNSMAKQNERIKNQIVPHTPMYKSTKNWKLHVSNPTYYTVFRLIKCRVVAVLWVLLKAALERACASSHSTSMELLRLHIAAVTILLPQGALLLPWLRRVRPSSSIGPAANPRSSLVHHTASFPSALPNFV